jgi:ribose 5-phosphate isomerase RpiB
MRIAIINETSAADKNPGILAALEGYGHDIINVGMKERGVPPEIDYGQAALLGAILLNLKRVDLVVGGCGTGQGFSIAAAQYPGVFCGHILTPLDAWLFMQINGGNCISLALNQGYGWAGEVNLMFIFEKLFCVECGVGYPAHRKEPQKIARQNLYRVSEVTHAPFARIIEALPDEVIRPALEFPGVRELIDVDAIPDPELKNAFQARLGMS